MVYTLLAILFALNSLGPHNGIAYHATGFQNWTATVAETAVTELSLIFSTPAGAGNYKFSAVGNEDRAFGNAVVAIAFTVLSILFNICWCMGFLLNFLFGMLFYLLFKAYFQTVDGSRRDDNNITKVCIASRL